MGKKKIRRKVKPPVSPVRRIMALIISGVVGIVFTVTMALVVEARHTSFYGEPLREKVISLAQIHLYGVPDDPEMRAQVLSGMPQLNLLPAEAVLHQDIAGRFVKLGIHFGYVQKSARPGNGRYLCKETNTDLVPAVAWNIAAALYPIPDETLKKINLEYIIFCGDLYRDAYKVGGFPVPVNNLMMLNLTHRTQNQDIQEFFLHEFYHLFESRWGLTRDPEWDRLFGAGYYNTYQGNDGAANSRIGTGNYGFINRYSQSFPYEDRAEIFALLMTDRSNLINHIADQRDEMLYAKVKYVAETARQKMGIEIPAF